MDKILIADDNLQITRILSEFIRREGFEPVVAYDGAQALECFAQDRFAMLLLDVMMPKIDGFELCRKIRRVSSVPIILITARGEDFERIMGLDIGADDYIVKPFSGEEVMARVRAVLRRIERPAENGRSRQLVFDNLSIFLDDAIVTIDGKRVPLTKKELEILWTLAENREKLFSRDALLSLLWGYDYFGDSRTVDSHVKRLRAKLDAVPHPRWQIKTVWGMGYKFEAADDEA
ncbi:response regulator [Beduinella massiliensis]|uniref:response regulator n=1 Tax=Beduinella massiliensis TaxID=1852363 RepID=UPI000C831751